MMFYGTIGKFTNSQTWSWNPLLSNCGNRATCKALSPANNISCEQSSCIKTARKPRKTNKSRGFFPRNAIFVFFSVFITESQEHDLPLLSCHQLKINFALRVKLWLFDQLPSVSFLSSSYPSPLPDEQTFQLHKYIALSETYGQNCPRLSLQQLYRTHLQEAATKCSSWFQFLASTYLQMKSKWALRLSCRQFWTDGYEIFFSKILYSGTNIISDYVVCEK